MSTVGLVGESVVVAMASERVVREETSDLDIKVMEIFHKVDPNLAALVGTILRGSTVTRYEHDDAGSFMIQLAAPMDKEIDGIEEEHFQFRGISHLNNGRFQMDRVIRGKIVGDEVIFADGCIYGTKRVCWVPMSVALTKIRPFSTEDGLPAFQLTGSKLGISMSIKVGGVDLFKVVGSHLH